MQLWGHKSIENRLKNGLKTDKALEKLVVLNLHAARECAQQRCYEN